jgi:hypothetical protein
MSRGARHLPKGEKVMKRRLRAPSPALVISLIALFVALGGTTYAATSLAKNSVGTAQLKNGAVTKAKISKKAVSALKGSRGPQGVQGIRGTNGTNGTNGTDGQPGAPGIAFVTSVVATNESTTSTTPTDLATPGPSVAVNVPASGVIEVFAQVDIEGGASHGVVTLEEDGSVLPGQSTNCGIASTTGGILGNTGIGGLTSTVPGECFQPGGPPGLLMFHTTPGVHTYKLVYWTDGTAFFSKRQLSVAPGT